VLSLFGLKLSVVHIAFDLDSTYELKGHNSEGMNFSNINRQNMIKANNMMKRHLIFLTIEPKL
jgi:hypothetical protein